MSIRTKVDRLEQVMIELAQSQKRLHEELLEFKKEMREFKEEVRNFIEDAKKQREEDRRKFEEFKEEMRNAQKRSDEGFERFRDEMNKKWGWLINKFGTLVEDLFYPSFDIAIKKHFGVELERKEMRKYRRKRERSMEMDVVGVGDGKVFVLEVKATPDKIEYIESVKKLGEFFEFFPEYKGLELIPIYGS